MSLAARLRASIDRCCSAFSLDARAKTALLLTLGGIPVVIVLSASLIMSQTSAQARLAAELDQALRAQILVEDARATLVAIETGQRGFLLTGNETYLAPYRNGLADLGGLARSLTQEMAGKNAQSVELVALASVTGRKLDELAMTLNLHREGRTAEALELVREGKGHRLMIEIQFHLNELAQREQRHADALRDELQQIARRINALIVVASLVLMALSITACILGGRALSLANASRQDAEMANRTKTTFLAMMSHELRTPMNGVLGMAHLLEHSGLNESQAERVRIIRSCGEGLMVILNDILDISKIEADKFELDAVEFAPVDVVRHALDMLRPAAEAKDLFLDLKVSGLPDAFVSGDPNRLRQILVNLLSNAVKFTSAGGVYVRVHLPAPDEATQTVKIVVADTGPGISAEAQKRLFQPFVQADSSITRQFGGTGLGLAISRRLARMMGGDIHLVSENGSGASFTFTGVFPVAARNQAIHPESLEEPEPVDLAGLRILAAEDNPHNQAVLRGLLEAVGCDVHVVADGRQALDALHRGTFDLVLMDIQMPVLDGVGALNQIRARPDAVSQIPVLALTANAKVGDRETYLDKGFDDHVPKPISSGVLLNAIVTCVERASQRRRGAPSLTLVSAA
jgi:signal transduction histidine kinase/ActR/RegA family two-component response regulator